MPFSHLFTPSPSSLTLDYYDNILPFSSANLRCDATLQTNATSPRFHIPTLPIPSLVDSLTPCANASAYLASDPDARRDSRAPLPTPDPSSICSIPLSYSLLISSHPITLHVGRPTRLLPSWPPTGISHPCGTNRGMSMPSSRAFAPLGTDLI